MKIFVSWSGERSQALAAILHERLPYILQYLEPWLSKSDIDAGDRWGVEVAKELEACTFGITCLTAENVAAPWILFEAGALAKSMQEGRVVPLLLDLNISDIAGPLAQFQAKKADKAGLLDVVQAINKIAPTPLAESRLKPLFEEIWPNLEKAIGEVPKAPGATKRARPQGEILEELVDRVRDLDGRYREFLDDGGPSPRRRRPRYHPMMIQELMHRVSDGPEDAMNILLMASFFREDFPWIYELGLEVYRAVQDKKAPEARVAYGRFTKALDMLRRGPFLLEEMGMDKRTYMQIDEMRHMLEYSMKELEDVKPIRERPRSKPKL